MTLTDDKMFASWFRDIDFFFLGLSFENATVSFSSSNVSHLDRIDENEDESIGFPFQTDFMNFKVGFLPAKQSAGKWKSKF